MIVSGQHAPYLDHQARGLSIFRAGVQGPGSLVSFQDLSFHAPWSSIGISINGTNGAKIRTGFKGYYPAVPFDCSIMATTIEADAAGSITFDIYRAPAGSVPAKKDTLTPLQIGRPKLVGAQIMRDYALFGWTKSLKMGDVLGFDVLSASGLNFVTLALLVSRNQNP